MTDDTSLSPIHEHNRRAWDARVRQQQRFTKPAGDDEMRSLMNAFDRAWLGSIHGRELLCLAAGGGRQGVLYAAAGARVTVVDISPEMLRLDREVAAARGLEMRTVEASMDRLDALATASFDIVIHPVSTCYVPDILAVYREVARVMVPGGLYISQHKQPASLQADLEPTPRGYELVEPYERSGPLPPVANSLHREEGTLEFLHSWEDMIGGLCRAGFVIEDLREPPHGKPDAPRGSFAHRSRYVPPYVRIKARRVGAPSESGGGPRLWTPSA